MTNLDSILKSIDITLPTKILLVKAMVFPVVMYGCELDCEESWAPKNWRFWTVVLEKTLESPLDCKEIQPVHLKGDQSWVFIGRTGAEAETPVLWPPDAKSWLIWKDTDVGKDWGQEEKGTTEDEMAGWHHQLSGHGFRWTTGVGDGQGGLACCSSWGCKESDRTEQLNWTESLLNLITKEELFFRKTIICLRKRNFVSNLGGLFSLFSYQKLDTFQVHWTHWVKIGEVHSWLHCCFYHMGLFCLRPLFKTH